MTVQRPGYRDPTDPEVMALGIRWRLTGMQGVPEAMREGADVLAAELNLPPAEELADCRDEWLARSPVFAAAYAAAATADGWREYMREAE